MLHRFSSDISNIELPEKFTYPFHYTPHRLSLIACEELKCFISTQLEIFDELQLGKMFGVLVVQSIDGTIGFLSAFSGCMKNRNDHNYFVPSICDSFQSNVFFREQESCISEISNKINQLTNSNSLKVLEQYLISENSKASIEIANYKEFMVVSKGLRDAQRNSNQKSKELSQMIKESQFQGAELKRIERKWRIVLDDIRADIAVLRGDIVKLKLDRKIRSSTLQRQLFDQFNILNAVGEEISLSLLFSDTPQKTPPSGAGECAAPKLLQYAFLNDLKPIALAEFWWGASPKSEVRHHGQFYPACRGKCKPILEFMLKGLIVEHNPLELDLFCDYKLDIVYEDKWILAVNKPAGMLSVPGKLDVNSVYTLLKKDYPQLDFFVVHRLDMATSGVLLVSKGLDCYRVLQSQFRYRSVKKSYLALLDGVCKDGKGQISLPICSNPLDRPRQVIDYVKGKEAITRYVVISRENNETRVEFYPVTGRTHQLRVHSAHFEGLNIPIKGDVLYGTGADRLYLHAKSIEFVHPVTRDIVYIDVASDF